MGVERRSLWARPRCFNWLAELALKSSLSDAISSSVLLLLKDQPHQIDSQAAWPDRDQAIFPCPSFPCDFSSFPFALNFGHFTLHGNYFSKECSDWNCILPYLGLQWAGSKMIKRESWTVDKYFCVCINLLWHVCQLYFRALVLHPPKCSHNSESMPVAFWVKLA